MAAMAKGRFLLVTVWFYENIAGWPDIFSGKFVTKLEIVVG